MIDAARIIEIVGDSGVVKDMSKFDSTKTFKENGVDSLDIFTILLAIQEQLDVCFSEDESNRIEGIQDVLELLNK